MKDLLKYTLEFIIVSSIVYVIFALTEWKLDMSMWHEISRLFWLIVSLASFLFYKITSS